MPNRASALLASLAASILLVAAPGAHAQGTCDENTSFVLDWPDIGEVTDLYVTSETNPGRLYTIREQGVNSMLEVADVRSILDSNPATADSIREVTGGSLVIPTAFPPVAMDMLESGPFSGDYVALALGQGGVGVMFATPPLASNLSVLPMPGRVWDVDFLKAADPGVAHVFVAAGSGGLRLADFSTAGLSLIELASASFPGDARGVKAYNVGADTVVVVANTEGLRFFRSNATKPVNQNFPNRAVLDTREGRMFLLPGELGSTIPTWTFDLETQRWKRLTPSGATTPAARRGFTAVYDSLNNRVVVWGGDNESFFPGGLDFKVPWILRISPTNPDSVTWIPAATVGVTQTPDARPRAYAATVYDPLRDRVVTTGGLWRNTTLFTSEWNDWSTAFNNTGPGNLRGIWGASLPSAYAVGDSGRILKYSGIQWQLQTSPVRANLYGVWGSSASNIFAVGDSGRVVRYNGTSWAPDTSGVTTRLRGVWGTAGDDVFAVGDNGVVIHYDGVSWSPQTSGTSRTLHGVWGTAGDHVYAVGDSGTIVTYNGATWSSVSSGVTRTLRGIWGSDPSNVYIVGDIGLILHSTDGTTWTQQVSNTENTLNGIFGTAGNDIFAVGEGGAVLHNDSFTWLRHQSGVASNLRGVWGNAPDSVLTVGFTGTSRIYRGGAHTWAFNFADSTWTVLDPVPTNQRPYTRTKAAAVFIPGGDLRDGVNRPDRMFVLGGELPPAGVRFEDFWTLDLETDTWYRPLTRGVPPPDMAGHLGVYDEQRDRVYFYGDTTGTSPLIDPAYVWYLDLEADAPGQSDVLGTWGVYRPPFIAFPPRIDMAAVYDPLKDGILIFGGRDSTNSWKNDLQLLDPTTFQFSRILPSILTEVDSMMTPGSAEDLARWGDTVFVADGLEGVAVVEMASVFGSAGADTVWGNIDTGGYARRVSVVGPYLYVSTLGNGLQIWNVTTLDPIPTNSPPVASYQRLHQTANHFVIGWGAQTSSPRDSAFVFVADSDIFTVVQHDSVDTVLPKIVMAPVERAGLDGQFSIYALPSECVVDSLTDFAYRFLYAHKEMSCDTCTTMVVLRDSTAIDSSLTFQVVDQGRRLWASDDLLDIRPTLDSIATALPTLVQDSLRLEVRWSTADRSGNTNSGSKKVKVALVDGSVGGSFPALDPRIRLEVDAGSFSGRAEMHFVEREDGLFGLPSESRTLDLLYGLPDPAMQGLIPAGPAVRVAWSPVTLRQPLHLVMPVEEAGGTAGARGASPAAEGRVAGIYRYQAGGWERVGGDLDGATVGAAIDRGGLYRVLLGEASSTALDYTRLLDQNVPNPFNPSTLIRFRVPQDGPVSLRIYDVQGRLVRTLVHGHHEAGEDAALWNGADDAGHAAAGGVYFYRLESGERTEARKMVLIK